MLEDVTKSIKSSLYDRVSSPLFGAFAISWCLINYKLLLILFSSLLAGDKIKYIESTLYPDFLTLFLFNFLYPIIASSLFIFLYPIPAKYIYEYWHSQQIKLKKIKQTIEDETPLTIEESREIRREILSLESEYETEINRKNAENNRLKELVSDLENDLLNTKNQKTISPAKQESPQPKKTAKPRKTASTTITEEQSEILKSIAGSGGFKNDSELISSSSFDRVKTEYLLEDLKAKGYVTYGYNSTYVTKGAELTTIGKKYAVEHEFVN